MLSITLAGEPAVLLPSGALVLPAQDTLLVADVHLGKARSFRRLGVPVPEATTAATLASLDAALAASGAHRLVVLGDFLHARRGLGPDLLDAMLAWRQRHPRVQLQLVRGNHDRHAGDPPDSLGAQVLDGPVRLGPFALCHEPEPVPGAYALAGHWHPCVGLRGAGRDSLRLPCFWLGDPHGPRAVGVLPAFGAFTGMHAIERAPGDRVYALCDGQVREVPAPAHRGSLTSSTASRRAGAG